jgi:hypothetical protein
LSSRASAELVVDASRLVSLGADDVQSTGGHDLGALFVTEGLSAISSTTARNFSRSVL